MEQRRLALRYEYAKDRYELLWQGAKPEEVVAWLTGEVRQESMAPQVLEAWVRRVMKQVGYNGLLWVE